MASDYNVWKCTCGAINDWEAPCKNGHGYFNAGGGDVRLWQCSSCKTLNAWNRNNCNNCGGKYVAP